jgi:6-pyruvoyltetrahydropterin/6-carboxytetrahydropterin synthase
MQTTCSKTYPDFPFGHRQPSHAGHCRFVHGHNWSFHFTFEADCLDECGFVVDFGGLQWLKELLNWWFDHTTVLNEDDPLLDYFQRDDINGGPDSMGLYDLRVVPDCSCEGLAKFVFELADGALHLQTDGRVRVKALTLHEDSKNSATYSR